MDASMISLILPTKEKQKMNKCDESRNKQHWCGERTINQCAVHNRLFNGPMSIDHTTTCYTTTEPSSETNESNFGQMCEQHPSSQCKSCLLVSEPASSEFESSFHLTNLLFQAAVTTAKTNRSSCDGLTSTEPALLPHSKQNVTIITPKVWEKLPTDFVDGVVENDIEQTLTSNRINFVYPKTYEELIIYIMALSSNPPQTNRNLFIIDDIDYYINQTEKLYLRANMVGGTSMANDTTMIASSNDRESSKKLLTKLLAIIHGFLLHHNRTTAVTRNCENQQNISSTQNGRKHATDCKFFVGYSPTNVQILTSKELNKLHMWMDEVRTLSPREEIQKDLSNENAGGVDNVKSMTCTRVDESTASRQIFFVHNKIAHCYVVNSLV